MKPLTGNGLGALLIAALALAACAPKSSPEATSPETTAAEAAEPEIDLELQVVLDKIKHESHFIKGLHYHGFAWWSYEKVHDSDSWPWVRYWDLWAYADSDMPDFSKAGGDFEIPSIALNDMVNFDSDIPEYDEETSTFSAHHYVGVFSAEFTRVPNGLKRTVSDRYGMVEYATYDKSILDVPVSRDVQIHNFSLIEHTDDLLIRIEQPLDRSDRIGEMSLWAPIKWIPIPAIGVLPFDKIDTVEIIEGSAPGHIIELIGTGLGRKLRSRLTILEAGHNVEIADAVTGQELITARKVYEVDRDDSLHW